MDAPDAPDAPDQLDALAAEVAVLRRHLNTMLAALHSTMASWNAALEAFVALAEHTELAEVDGVPVGEWLRGRFRKHMDEALCRAENDDPALAARWQAQVDEWYFRSSESR